MGQMEHVLNVYTAKAAKGAVADFMGFMEVEEAHATARLTTGLWLVRAFYLLHHGVILILCQNHSLL